ncbi:MAG: tetratricopeptide repeat protein [Atribacterota bacterium]|nr:tetratricopeptide repeat protein [Atribacterota bacterium]MDD5637793.1 tetratricopeptide repeat protein [Atribacterota bacterium]
MKLNKSRMGFYLIILLAILFQLIYGSSLAQQVNIFSDATPEAVEYLEKAVEKMEEALATYQGANYPGRKLWTEAIDLAQQAIAVNPDFVEAHYYLALMYQHTNWYYREAEQWNKYLSFIERTDLTSPQVKQNLAHAYYRLGYTSYEKGDYEQSLIYFLNSIKEYPDLIDSNYWAARVFYENNDLENSLFYWRRVLELDPNYPRAQYFYDKVDASIKYGKEAYNWYEQGYNEYEKMNYGRAIDSYREAIRLNSRFVEAYYWLARVYFDTGDYQQAIRYYRQVLNLQPDNTRADYWLKEAQRRLEGKK